MKSKLIPILLAITLITTLFVGCSSPAKSNNIVDVQGNTATGTAAGTAAPNSTPNGTLGPSATPDNSDLDGIPDPTETIVPKKTLEEYKAINSDVIGWITVPNTNVDYPVVRTDNNEYYLRQNVEKKKSKAGAIFMDYRNADKYQQRHLIIYGHNMRDGSMFHDLNNYKLKEFFDANKVITLTLNGKKYKYEVYAAFVAQVNKVYFNKTQFGGAADFAQFMNQLAALSKFKTGVKIKESDQVLSLSTCTYEYDNSRFVVQARRIS